MNAVASPKRAYRQTARAQMAEETARRILEAFAARLMSGWFDEIRLEDVAAEAGVTVQTVIRRFGGKDGLLDAATERLSDDIRARRRVAAGDLAAAVHALAEDYEQAGDLVMRILAQEDRYPAIRRMTDEGRRSHRAWVEAVFAPGLAGLPADAAQRRTDALVAATDIYIWKLLRRDLKRPLAEYRALVSRLVQGALAGDPE